MKGVKILGAKILIGLQSIILSTRLVFSKWSYIMLGGAITAIFWIIFNVFDQLLFFSPVVTFYLPSDAVSGFILSNITAVFMGAVVSMNIYVLRHSSKFKTSILSLFSGSSISILSSTCASCSSIGFLLVSTFGGLGVTASTFLTNYQVPLRIISIGLMIWAYYSISNKLTKSCILNSAVVSDKKINNE